MVKPLRLSITLFSWCMMVDRMLGYGTPYFHYYPFDYSLIALQKKYKLVKNPIKKRINIKKFQKFSYVIMERWG